MIAFCIFGAVIVGAIIGSVFSALAYAGELEKQRWYYIERIEEARSGKEVKYG